MKTILVTGINGFLGSQLAKTLAAEFNIVGLEHSVANLHRLQGYNFTVYDAQKKLEEIFEQHSIDTVIHAATLYKRQQEPAGPVLRTNVLLPVELYELANKHGVTNFVNIDSFFNNPQFNYKYLVDYTLSKKQVNEWLQVLLDKCNVINMKLYHMYGENDAPDKFIPAIASRILKGEQEIALTSGEQVRDFIYVKDVVDAFGVVVKHFTTPNQGYSEFEVGTGVATTLRQLVEVVKKVSGSASALNFGALPMRENEIMYAVANNTALAGLGWHANHTLEQGLTEVLKTL